jgi:hypothetical protein
LGRTCFKAESETQRVHGHLSGEITG